ncbi:MAG: adenylate/guanylate cyclase domain-containing protein [Betaproteobacteria bacterium]
MGANGGQRCANCGADNRAARRFCADCGAVLPLACPACGFANQVGEKFCGGCGTPLAAPSPVRTPDAADAERRPVTVLFVDICGYTQLSQRLDPEDVHRLLESFFAVVDGIVQRFGGHVDKHIGDAVMAIFGAPLAHGDDPMRAVRAADAIARAVRAITVESDHPLQVHIGIASGEVIASDVGSEQHRAYTVIGPSVNLAARLVGIAGPGEIALDDAVHEALSPLARCIALGEVAIKGIDHPVAAWRLAGLDGGASAAAMGPMVGRVTERVQLAALLEQCTATRRGHAVLVRGEPGIGKSRLVAELCRMARTDGFACHTGLVLDFGMAEGRDAIREVVRSLLGLSPSAGPDARSNQAEAVVGRGICTEEERPFLYDLVDLPLPETSRAIYQAMDSATRQRGRAKVLNRLVAAGSQVTPVLLCIEDVHWADKMTLSYVAAILQGISRLPVVVALTTRSDGDPLDAAWRASIPDCPLMTLDLAPLRAEEAVALAGGLFTTSNRFAQRCVERADGNPLFLEQLLRAADDGEDRLPSSLHNLLLARVDRLPERDRTALRAASVIGQRFSRELVCELMRLPDYDCAPLLAHHLVRVDGDDFLFAHALVRDGVYASLTRARRNALHVAAGTWYEERDLALRAGHLDRGESPDAPQAYWQAARAQAIALHLERALVLADRGAAVAQAPRDICSLNLLRSELLREIGDGKLASEASRAALAAALSPVDRCAAMVGVAAGHRLTGEVDEALATLAEAEAIAAAAALTADLVAIHYLRGNLHFARGRLVECRGEHAAAFAGATALQDPEWEARTVSGLADADYAQGLLRTAFARFSRCVALCDAHGYIRIAIPNRVMIGHCRIYLNEFEAGLQDMTVAAAEAVRVGNRHAEMFALQSRGWLLTACSRYAEAEPYQNRARDIAQSLGARRYLAAILAHDAEVLRSRGAVDEARSNLEEALALSRETGIGFCGPMVLGLMALCAVDDQTRQRHAAEAEAVLAAGCISHNYFFYYRYAIEAALDRDDFAAAMHYADALEAYTHAEPLPYSEMLIRRARTLATFKRDPRDPACLAELESLMAETQRLRWPIGWPERALVALQ